MWACTEIEGILPMSFGTCDQGKYMRSYDGTTLLPTPAVNCKVDQCSRFSECQTQAKGPTVALMAIP